MTFACSSICRSTFWKASRPRSDSRSLSFFNKVRFTGGGHGVSIRGATVLAGVEGVGTRSHHFYASETQKWHIGVPQMHHTYKFVPRWAGAAALVWSAMLLGAFVLTGDSLARPASPWWWLLLLGGFGAGVAAQVYRYVRVSGVPFDSAMTADVDTPEDLARLHVE